VISSRWSDTGPGTSRSPCTGRGGTRPSAAQGRDPPVARLPHARAAATWAWPGWPSPALSLLWPGRATALASAACCAGPAASRPRSCGWRMASPGWSQSGAVSRLDVPLPVWAYPGARFPRLGRSPGSEGCPGHPGAAGMTWQQWWRWPGLPVPCGQPLVPTSSPNLLELFSNNIVLAGAPLRNRTVDLLLTMQADTV